MAEPSQACGNAGTELAGCVFSLHPMADDFVDLILGALAEVDASCLWKQTDNVSTTVRGPLHHVVDFVHAATALLAATDRHVALQAMFSVGCPGDRQEHLPEEASDDRQNQQLANRHSRDVSGKFALYPMSGGDYMEVIYDQIEKMRAGGVRVELVHYCTRLDGPLAEIFAGMERTLAETAKVSPHTVLVLSISANSPSGK